MSVISVDYATLPAALLETAKDHCRINHDFDDTYILGAIARAIHWFEIKTETKVFAAEHSWTPAISAWTAWPGGSGWRSPISPVKSFKAFVDSVDVSGGYHFETSSTLDGTGTYYLFGAAAAGLSIQELKTGYTDIAMIPPGILDRILTYTSTLYENRELFVPAGQFLNPEGRNQDLAGWWVPKA